MALQDIFDNDVFFEGYRRLRQREGNANDVFEIPALFSLLPDLRDKAVLDLGCGFGEHCVRFAAEGARRVVGIDISEKMLDVARRENHHERIEYIRMPMEELSCLTERFDIAVSSLAMHYVDDFAGVVRSIHDRLTDGGTLVFSQEHPLNTCYAGGERWTKDENGRKLYLNLAGYGREGERETEWFVANVRKYHRTFSTIVNTLTDAGFVIERMIEPLPTEEILARYPEQYDLFHKPDFLLVRAKKA